MDFEEGKTFFSYQLTVNFFTDFIIFIIYFQNFVFTEPSVLNYKLQSHSFLPNIKAKYLTMHK